ncbi:hypothetical protein BCV72DRAFT_301189 [Rhizopus microsporus var. microsporus]|uniref:Uncharacterized protein n=1 Tax=Rhizopus microsporus var. microsporus TaxID=86635 RepID=A0A1X0RGG0_RHIZD|nr:hypothetical protein BCV72DRAFT_301189 [Rhizopus microsporus var. microsporus]
MKNPQYNFIKKEHLCKAVRPSFTKFSTTKEQEIIKRSVHVPFNHSLDLQNTRIRFYSNTAVVERPKTPTVPKATKTSDTFKRMFIQKEASAQVSAASSTAIGNQAQRSATLLNDVNESEEEEVDIEGDDDKWDAEEDEEEELNGGNDNNEDEEEVELENEEENSGGYTSKIRNMAIAKLLDLKHTVEVINISIKDSNCNNQIYSIAAKSFKKYNDVQLSQEDQYLEMTKNTNKQFSKIVACIEEYEKESKPVTLKRLKKYAEDGAKYTDKKLKTNVEDIVVTPIEQEKTSADLFFAVQQREKYESMFRWATCYEEGQK